MERQIFLYPRFIGCIEDRDFSEMAFALRAFGLQQVAPARLATQHFAARRYLEALGYRFLRFASRYRFWHKEPGIYTLSPC